MKVKPVARLFLHKILLIIISFLFSAGCIHLKGKSHNDILASQETIRQIEPIKLEEVKEEDTITLDTRMPELAEIRLSLEECKALAIENNLGLKVQLINPVMAAEMVTQEKARFDVSVLGDVTYNENNTPVATLLEIAGNKYDTVNNILLSSLDYVPAMDGIRKLAKEIADSVYYGRLLALDFTVNSNGDPLLIDINCWRNGIHQYQMHNGGLFKEFTKEILDYCQQCNPRFVLRV